MLTNLVTHIDYIYFRADKYTVAVYQMTHNFGRVTIPLKSGQIPYSYCGNNGVRGIIHH